MIRHILPALLISLLAACGSDGDWVTHQDAEGRYSAVFPDESEEQESRASLQVLIPSYGLKETNRGTVEKARLKGRDRVAWEDGRSYSVVYNDIPRERVSLDSAEIESFLNRTCESTVSGSSGTLLSMAKISQQGHPGREMFIRLTQQDAIIRMRIILADFRVYYVYSGAHVSNRSPENDSIFFNWFKLKEG